jgi:hypothetical protein
MLASAKNPEFLHLALFAFKPGENDLKSSAKVWSKVQGAELSCILDFSNLTNTIFFPVFFNCCSLNGTFLDDRQKAPISLFPASARDLPFFCAPLG